MTDMVNKDTVKVWRASVLFTIQDDGKVAKSFISVEHRLCEYDLASKSRGNSPELSYVPYENAVFGGRVRIFASEMDCVYAAVSTDADGNIIRIYIEGFSLSYKTILNNIVKCLKGMPNIRIPETDLKYIMNYEFT